MRGCFAAFWMMRLLPSLAALLAGASIAAAQGVPLVVSTEWLAAHLGDSNVVVIQAGGRQPDATAERIPGTRYVPYAAFAVPANGLANELPSPDSLRSLFASVGVSDNSHVVLTGQPLSVTRAFYSLDYLGHPRVSVLDGGLTKWKREGRPIESAARSVTPGRLSARAPRADIVASAEWVLDHMHKRGTALFDTRTVGEYIGAEGANGHIDGARFVDWRQYFTNLNDFELADRATLERLFDERAEPGDTVIAYCAVGFRASGTYFVSRLLGKPVKLYDGSYDDWSKRKLPVVTAATPLRTGEGMKRTGGTLPAVSPDGRHIAFVAVRDGKQSDTYVIGADGQGERQLTRTPQWDERPSWIGSRLFTSTRSGDSARTFTVNADGSNLKAVATLPGREAGAAPNGSYLVSLAGEPRPLLKVYAANGANERSISDTTRPAPTNPSWSSDLSRLTYAGFDFTTSNMQIFVMNADGSDVRAVTGITSADGRPARPAWSPDGKTIAFHVTRDNPNPAARVGHIYVVEVATGAITKLAPHDNGYVDEAPSWFPDGKRIAFHSDRTGTMHIWVMNADGTGARQVTSWQPR